MRVFPSLSYPPRASLHTPPVIDLTKHMPALDGVRGLAILMVLFDHFLAFNNHTTNRLVNSLSALAGLGWMGVDLFFVLSGFLITGILYDTVQSTNFFRNFYMRRFLRIFPLYYGFLFVLLFLSPVLHQAWGTLAIILFAYQQNASIWFPPFNFYISPILNFGHLWSLAVEEQFYFVWPLIVFFVRERKKLIRIAILLSIVALALRIFVHFLPLPNYARVVHEWTLCRMDTLMIGGCLALLMRGKNPWLTKQLGITAFAISMTVMAAIAISNPLRDINRVVPIPAVGWNSFFFVGTLGYTMLALGFSGLLIVALTPGSLAHRLFQMAWLRSLGKYSYGMYVLQFFVWYVFTKSVSMLLNVDLKVFLYRHLHSHAAADLTKFLLEILVIYGAAWTSFNLYEAKFLRLKDKFAYNSARVPTPSEAIQ